VHVNTRSEGCGGREREREKGRGVDDGDDGREKREREKGATRDTATK